MLSIRWRWLVCTRPKKILSAKSRFSQSLLFHSIPSTCCRWLIFFSKIFLSPPMLSIRCRWLWYCSFLKIFLSAGKVVFRSLCFFTRYPPFVAGGYGIAHFWKFLQVPEKSFFAVSAFSLDTLLLCSRQNFPLYFVMGSFPPATALHFQNFSKSYLLHSLQVAMVLL